MKKFNLDWKQLISSQLPHILAGTESLAAECMLSAISMSAIPYTAWQEVFNLNVLKFLNNEENRINEGFAFF